MTEKSSKTQNAALQAVPKLIALLSPLTPEEQRRAIAAAFILLGKPENAGGDFGVGGLIPGALDKDISPKAAPWMKNNSITRDQLDQLYTIDAESIEVIASTMPGKGKRQQTVQAYLICGLKSFLGSGDTLFTDKQARELCIKVGCYDTPNHASYMKDLGNWVSGTKDSGWKLTNPGLSEAARIVKQLTDPSNR